MKNFKRLALVSGLLGGTAVSAAPFMAVGDGANLLVTGSVGVRADDNIFLVNNATSDTIFTFAPGLELDFGKDAQVNGSITLVDSFESYANNSKLNTDLFSGDALAGYKDAKLDTKFNLGYHQLNQNTADLSGLIRRDETVAGGKGEVVVSEKTSVSAGVDFNHTNYHRTNYGDSDETTVPLNFYYKMTEKIDLSLGYRYRNYSTTIGLDSNDSYYNVGARGQFTEKLSGEISVGINQRRLSGLGGTQTDPGVDGSLVYKATEKTTLQFGVSNDYSTAPQGAQEKALSLNGMATIMFSEQWTFNAGLSWRDTAYHRFSGSAPHEDYYVEGTVGAVYTVNKYLHITGSYTYRNNDSGITGGDFTNNVFALSASLRY